MNFINKNVTNKDFLYHRNAYFRDEVLLKRLNLTKKHLFFKFKILIYYNTVSLFFICNNFFRVWTSFGFDNFLHHMKLLEWKMDTVFSAYLHVSTIISVLYIIKSLLQTFLTLKWAKNVLAFNMEIEG